MRVSGTTRRNFPRRHRSDSSLQLWPVTLPLAMTDTAACTPFRDRHPRPPLRRAVPLAGAAALALTLGACSTWSLTGSTPAPASEGAPSSSSFTSRVTSLFSGSSGSVLASTPDLNCPNIEYRQGAATWSVKGAGGGDDNSAAMGLRYQASLAQTARECIASESTLTIKVGVQGRMVLGPAGSPGTVSLPLRYALVREGLHPKTLWTRMFTVPVTVPSGELNLTWMHVEEEMTIPRPSPQELDAYVVYVGFDPQGTGTPAARPRTARAR